jgi:hypothetical protein
MFNLIGNIFKQIKTFTLPKEKQMPISQLDPKLPKDMQDFGCLFFSMLYQVGKQLNKTFSVEEAIAFYETGKATGSGGQPIIGDECYINDVAALWKLFGGKYSKMEVLVEPSLKYTTSDYVVQTWYNPHANFTHFVAGRNTVQTVGFPSNAAYDRITVEYDPLGKSNTVANGYLKSITIFRG